MPLPRIQSRLFQTIILALSFLVAASHARWDEKFTVRKKITIDASATGTAIGDPIGAATVLVRLHDGNFQFNSAKEDGSDIRFIAADDKTPLPFHIEKFDALLHEALVWVKLPEVKPSAKTEFWIYYGNPAAERAGDPRASYDGDTVLVYHFAENNAAASDATSLANNAQTVGTTVGTLIGSGIRLGTPAPVTLPASPSLNWSEGAALTWSAWVKFSTLEPGALFFSRRDGGRSFSIGADSGAPFVAVGAQRSAAGAPLTAGGWNHIAAVAEPGKITLYVNGENYATLAASLPALNTPALLGGDTAAGEVSAKGELDELQISRVARPAGFIKLAAIAQAGEKAARLVVFGEDEQGQADFLSRILGDGYLGVIVRNLTVDGWVVIVILAVMAVVSWFVVIGKWRYLTQITAGNKLFFAEWKRLSGDLGAVEDDPAAFGKALPSAARKTLARSPLFAVFRIGIEEIGHRMALREGQPKSLTSRGIQSIRAALDGGLVVETERLNSGIVLLTIAISGGPFLGLLGTVVGVMITFAAVAAAGDVNVNAIAPGIAAALLATVAGLAVAIPALFAYNYLLTRIKAATRDLNVFIDSFVTKMAEQYRGGPAE
jgi:biopolymer transport protein ExbB